MMKHIFRRTLFLLGVLALAVFLCLPSASCAAEAPLLRVLLRRLNITTRMDIRLEGQYLLKSDDVEMLFPRGSEMTVELRDHRLVLFFSGASVPMGSSVTLSRRDDGGDPPALRIGLNAAGVYPGDLSLTIAEDKIQPVLSLNLEDYLPGVVPNEMSESFPLEALKAQAVCARTYAMRKIGSTGDWDVVDTTNDQVFRAVVASNTKSAKAVEETAGLVITAGGKLIEAWYSASNGGQTELPSHVWGGTNYADCYEMKDDPWDAANPDSVTRTVELNKDGTGLYRRISRLLREAVFSTASWKKGGFVQSEEAFRVDAITAVQVKTPRYESPSRLMTELEITMNVSGKRSASGDFESAGPGTVTLQVFPDVLDALGLRVASSSNEIMTVEETETTFRLVTARYGHGVGLSQRGAQYMASKDGITFDQIIAFYFPGSEILRYTGETPAIPVASELLTVQPEEIVTETAAPQELMPVTETDLPEGAYVVSVENIADDSSLNLRADASPAASVIMRLYKHQHLIVLDDMDVPGWAKVRTDTTEGYIMTSFVEKVTEITE